MPKSLNKVQLIGNLTREPELRYTPNQTPVCTFGLATNREWATDGGEKQSSAEFHNLIAWRKLGELCKNLLHKGNRVYIEGRLQTRSWQGKDGQMHERAEIVVNDMILLTSRLNGGETGGDYQDSASAGTSAADQAQPPIDDTPVDDDSDIPF